MPNQRTLALITGSLMAAALAPLGSTSIAVALPVISTELNVAPGLITQLLVGGYLLVSVAGQIPGGKLVDRWGYQKV
ncbi:MAG: MFS transporter, partial [Pseudomonadales bacterium]